MTYRLAWITDPHLNFLPKPHGSKQFGKYVEEENRPDVIVITGDISECPYLEENLNDFWEGTARGRHKTELCFVLGNHDYYHGSFALAEKIAKSLSKVTAHGSMRWLGAADALPTPLTPTSCLVGQEGFYDALVGKRAKTKLIMNDFLLIQEFEPRVHGYVLNEDPHHKFGVMQTKSYKEAALAYKKLTVAVTGKDAYTKVYFATHYPPFLEACWHEGKVSDDTWSPYFVSKLMGDTLLRVADENPQAEFVVLCGHTHSPGEYQPRKNLLVKTGASQYRYPRVHEVIEVQ